MRSDQEMSIPVVRLEVEYMKHAILQAFHGHTLKVDEDVRLAVERFCTPENVRQIVQDAVERELTSAINEEVSRFYRYGAGKDFIARAVKAKLDNDEKFFKDNGLYGR